MPIRRIAVLLLLAVCGCSRVEAPHPKVVLIGLDGASWDVLDPLFEEGVLPHLDGVRRRGVTAELGTVEPVDSPTNWTTIATGRRPEAHGVTNFYATSDFIRVPTVWERLAEQGVRVGLYDYLITWPPRRLDRGFVIPGWTRLDDAVTPPDAFSRAGVTPYAYSVARLATAGSAIANAQRELNEKPPRWNRLVQAFSLDVGAVTFYSFDLISHRFWKPADVRQRSAVRDTALGMDVAMGEILETLGPETAVIFASDHGFQAAPEVRRRWSFHLSRWLPLAGLDPERDRFLVVNDWQNVILRIDPGPDAEAVLTRLQKLFASATDSAGAPLFQVETARNGPGGAAFSGSSGSSGSLSKTFTELVERTPSAFGFVLALPNRELLERVCPQEAIKTMGGAVPCGALAHIEEFTGAHHPTAFFLAAGGPIRHREERSRLHVLDIAPLLFYLAGQPIPDDLEGRLATEILDPEFLRRHPPRTVRARPLKRPMGTETPVEDPELSRRLRSLGYVN